MVSCLVLFPTPATVNISEFATMALKILDLASLAEIFAPTKSHFFAIPVLPTLATYFRDCKLFTYAFRKISRGRLNVLTIGRL